MPKPNPIKPVSLTELVRDVAEQLRELKRQPPPADEAVLGFKECSIELSVAATIQGGAGIKFYVVEVSGKGSTSATHKIKLTFSSVGDSIQATQSAASNKTPSVDELTVHKRNQGTRS